MLAINLAKLTEKFLGFTPYTIILIMCYTQVCLTVYTVEKITVDVNKMGVGRNAWKKVHLNILLTEGYIHLLGFFLTWAKKPLSTFLKPITIWQALSNKAAIQAKSKQYLCKLSSVLVTKAVTRKGSGV